MNRWFCVIMFVYISLVTTITVVVWQTHPSNKKPSDGQTDTKGVITSMDAKAHSIIYIQDGESFLSNRTSVQKVDRPNGYTPIICAMSNIVDMYAIVYETNDNTYVLRIHHDAEHIYEIVTTDFTPPGIHHFNVSFDDDTEGFPDLFLWNKRMYRYQFVDLEKQWNISEIVIPNENLLSLSKHQFLFQMNEKVAIMNRVTAEVIVKDAKYSACLLSDGKSLLLSDIATKVYSNPYGPSDYEHPLTIFDVDAKKDIETGLNLLNIQTLFSASNSPYFCALKPHYISGTRLLSLLDLTHPLQSWDLQDDPSILRMNYVESQGIWIDLLDGSDANQITSFFHPLG
jgi:hypothetical protein